MPERYDVIVIGGGHAGCEAALAAARLGAETLLLTINLDHIAQMSCNPAIGGIAKGHVVREIDALGGEMARNTDEATIQFRMLNRSKGPAVWSPRAQCDRVIYQRRMKHVLEIQEHLHIHQAKAIRLLPGKNGIGAVATEFGDRWEAASVVLCSGTFLNGQLHYGFTTMPGGRAGDAAAAKLSASLVDDLSLELGRLKTGTPTRVLGRSLKLKELTRQDPDPEPAGFAFHRAPAPLPHLGGADLTQRPCFITYSTEETARVVRDNLDRSPMYAGRIDGTGTRYCPSFEDKIVRFPERVSHQIYLEPEGDFTDEYYLNGISTSLPVDVQWQMVRSLPGLEQAHITRYAYAIEYDVVLPHQLTESLALRAWPNLFLAGQINGTSGYEEAAGQGLIAGINAARLAAGNPTPIVLGRDQAYIGVMIDDLVTKEIVEPYRLFTSRAEHRLLLRQDNAHLRLSQLGRKIGLLDPRRWDAVQALQTEIDRGRAALQSARLEGQTLWDRLRTPGTTVGALPNAPQLTEEAARHLETEARYEGYIRRQQATARALASLDNCPIPPDFSYDIKGLRTEARLKLESRRPRTLGQASRMDGVTPAEVALLQVHLKRHRDTQDP